MEIQGKYCNNSVIRTDVSSQVKCQTMCMNQKTCNGITYILNENGTNDCYLCNDDSLKPADSHSALYRRPSNILHFIEFHIDEKNQINCIYTLYK